MINKMLNCSDQEKNDYISAEIEIIGFFTDVIATSGPQGGEDGNGNGDSLDDTGWTGWS